MKRKRYLGAKPLSGTAPTEICIFCAGENATDHGPLLFDSDAASTVMAAYSERGIKLHFDYAHALPTSHVVADPDPQHQIAAGWFELALRGTDDAPELWAVNIKWTPAAKKAIEDLEWGYFSPWCYVEEETNRVAELRNIALTNDPAMISITPIAAIYDRRSASRRFASSLLSFDDIAAAINQALSDKYLASEGNEYAAWAVDVFDSTVVYRYGGELFRVSYAVSGADVTLGDDVVRVVASYVAVPASDPLQVMETKKSPRDCRVQVRPIRADSGATPGKPSVSGEESKNVSKGSLMMNRENILLALGLRHDASDTVLRDAASATIEILLSATQAKTASEAIGKIEGWAKAAHELEQAQARLVELERDARNKHVEDLLARGYSSRKVTPSMEPQLRAIGLDDPNRLAGLIDSLPVVLAMRHESVSETKPTVGVTELASGKKWDELTFSQKAALRKSNPEIAAALHSEYVARNKE